MEQGSSAPGVNADGSVFVPAVFYRDPRQALTWLQSAFGFESALYIEGKPGDVRTVHAEMTFGNGRIMVGGEWAEWVKSPRDLGGGNTQSVHVYLARGLDAHCEHARAAGAVITQEPEDQAFGDRTYRAVDLEGHMWTFAQRVTPR